MPWSAQHSKGTKSPPGALWCDDDASNVLEKIKPTEETSITVVALNNRLRRQYVQAEAAVPLAHAQEMHDIRLPRTCMQPGECLLTEQYSLSLLTSYRKAHSGDKWEVHFTISAWDHQNSSFLLQKLEKDKNLFPNVCLFWDISISQPTTHNCIHVVVVTMQQRRHLEALH